MKHPLSTILLFLMLTQYAEGTGLPQSEKTAGSRKLSIAMTGDIMMGTTVPGNFLPEKNGALLFREAEATLKQAELAIGNLEGTLCDTKGRPKPCTDSLHYFVFKTPQKYVENLVKAGFDAMNIANNHCNDFGAEGRDSTMSTLRGASIAFTGLKGACEECILTRNGRKIGLCSFSHSGASLSINDIPGAQELISRLRRQCDYVIVSFHGGAEGPSCTHVPRRMEIFLNEKRGDVYKFAHACIDAGADLVFGHGPHVVRAMELYEGHLIAYSLGNFCTPFRFGLRGSCGLAPLLYVELDENGRLLGGRIESYTQLRGSGPVRDSSGRAADAIRALSVSDFPGNGLRFDGENFYPVH